MTKYSRVKRLGEIHAIVDKCTGPKPDIEVFVKRAKGKVVRVPMSYEESLEFDPGDKVGLVRDKDNKWKMEKL